MKVDGTNGSLELTPAGVVITPVGGGSRTVRLAAIRGVQFQQGGTDEGRLQIVTGPDPARAGALDQQTEELVEGTNSISFPSSQNQVMAAFADAVNEALADL